jgi:DNA-binding transcriptional ArsR family regulator
MTGLYVPDLPPGCTVLDAALLYAAAGWYVLPVDPLGKHAGSLVGGGWHLKSSRDPETITAWFTGQPHWTLYQGPARNPSLALHVGRSGAVVLDVDTPALMPPVLADAIQAVPPPFQATRANDPARAHYAYAAEPGRFGNSGGDLGTDWGEVRGLNGIIVVAPTPHSKAAEGGLYRWGRTGLVPPIPDPLAGCLRPPGASHGTADRAEVVAFLAALPGGEPCPVVATVPTELPSTGRHPEMLRRTQQLVRFGEQGHQGAGDALEQLQAAFIEAVSGDRSGGSGQAAREYTDAVTGAVAAALAAPTPATERGCCPSHTDADGWAALGVDTAALRLAVPANGGPPALDTRTWTQQLRAMLLDADGLRSIPAPTPLVDGWLYVDSLAWLGGKPGHGKTFVAIDFALSVATGTDWLGHPVKQGRVLYVIAEGAAGLAQRVDAWQAAHGVAAANIAFLPMPVQLTEQHAVEAFSALLGEDRPALVVIDTQARSTVGADENSARDMGFVVAALERLRAASGACVLVVHHESRAGENLRGSTAIEGAATTIIRADKDGGLITVMNTKQKDAREALPFKAALREAGSSVVLSRDLGTAAEVLSASEAAVLDALERLEETSATRLVEYTGLSKSTVYRALPDLYERGLVSQKQQGNRITWLPTKPVPQVVPQDRGNRPGNECPEPHDSQPVPSDENAVTRDFPTSPTLPIQPVPSFPDSHTPIGVGSSGTTGETNHTETATAGDAPSSTKIATASVKSGDVVYEV